MHGNFARLAELLAPYRDEGIRGVLMDLGVSSMQIDRPERGFSYLQDGPLDMRMDADPSRENAAALIARLDTPELRSLLRDFGEVRRPGRVARAIRRESEAGRMTRCADLRRAVESALPGNQSLGELARTAQALRIAVNDELGALDAALDQLPACLSPGGRAVLISYHSLEDRRVKQNFLRESRDCLCPPELPVCSCGHKASYALLTRRSIRPAAEEIARNPRSRSARLRAVRRLDP